MTMDDNDDNDGYVLHNAADIDAADIADTVSTGQSHYLLGGSNNVRQHSSQMVYFQVMILNVIIMIMSKMMTLKRQNIWQI